MIATENPGFYNIADFNGAYVYPLIVQSIALPIIEVAVKLSKLDKPFAALTNMAEHIKEEKKNPDYEGMYLPLGLHHVPPESVTIMTSIDAKFEENNEKITDKIIMPIWDEDKVVALRVHEWPTVWESYISRIPESLRRERENLKGRY